MSPRLVVFDVDGTLVDSQAQILAAMEAAFAAVGAALPERRRALSVVGLSLPLALGRLRPEAGAAELAEMVAAYKSGFQRLRLSEGAAAAPLYPGTRAMLAALAAAGDTVLGLATGKSRRGLEHMIEMHALAPYFGTLQVADDHPSKPHPSMLRAALAETGADAARAVMIGDTAFDMEMGRAAGFRTVGVSWGYHPPEMLGAAEVVIGDWSGLGPALAGFGAAA